MSTPHTPGKWVWQKFGTHWCLTGQHGMRSIVLSVMGGHLTSLVDGRLVALDPSHPDAHLIASAPTLLTQRNELREALKRMTAIAAALVCNPAAPKAERECHASEFSQAMNQARVALRTEPDKANAVEVVLAPCQICGSNAVNPRTRHCMKCGRPQRIN